MNRFRKINLQDVTFLIPVRIDSASRLENLEIIVHYLSTYFNTNIYILELDLLPNVSNFIKVSTTYIFQHAEAPVFLRTEINNQLIHSCTTPLAVLYDTDIIITPAQLLHSVGSIRTKRFAFSLPYDGRFLEVDYYNKRLFKENLDVNFLVSGTNLYATATQYSVGGCFMFDVAEYKKCGMENEHIEGWGHDDAERVKRLQKLGYPVHRPEGPLYHLWHERSQNSYFYDEAREMKSFETYFRTCSISKEKLQDEIAFWPWTKCL